MRQTATADVLLLEKSLRAIADGVVEGRRIFANTTKYVLMGTSSNLHVRLERGNDRARPRRRP